jgi:hypothetical protein
MQRPQGVPLDDRVNATWAARSFWPKVDMTPRSGCWLWTGTRATRGMTYGRVYLPGGRAVSAHRVMWHLIVGPLSPGVDVLHSCDNAGCCNPGHLRAGDHEANMSDMRDRRRARGFAYRFGEQNPSAKLSNDQVREIRRRHATGETMAGLGREFGVGANTIWKIIHRVRWAQVD